MLRFIAVVVAFNVVAVAARADDAPPPPLEPGIVLDAPATPPAPDAPPDAPLDAAPAATPPASPEPAVSTPPNLADCTCACDDDDDERVRAPPERWPVPLLMLTAGGTALVAAVGLPLLGSGFGAVEFVPYNIRQSVGGVLALGPFLAPAIAGGAVYAGGGVDTVIGTTVTGYASALGLGVIGAVGLPIVLVTTNVFGQGPEQLGVPNTLWIVAVGIGVGGAGGVVLGEVLGSAAGPLIAAAVRKPDDVDEHE